MKKCLNTHVASFRVANVYSVGNKDDCAERKVVQQADARRLADQIGIPFIETSAKENKNVEEVSLSEVIQSIHPLKPR